MKPRHAPPPLAALVALCVATGALAQSPDGGGVGDGASDGAPARAPAPVSEPAAAEPEPADLDDLEALLNTPVDVATMNLTKLSLREAPSVVEVIGAPELKAWGYRSVAEALKHVVGLY